MTDRSMTPIVSGLVICAWGILGFFFWVPMIARAIALLSAATLYATTYQLGESYLTPAKLQLTEAVTFWSRGFALVLAPARSGVVAPGASNPIRWERIALEVATTGIFWFGFGLIFIIGRNVVVTGHS